MPMKTTIVDEEFYSNPIALELSGKQKEEYASPRDTDGKPFLVWNGVVQEMCDLIDQQERERSEHFENIKEWRWLYNATEGRSGGGITVTGPWADSANVHTPSTRDAVNTLHAHIMRVCVGIEPYARVIARPAHLMEKARLAEELLNYVLKDEVRFPDKLDLIIKDALIEGTKIAKIPWCRTVKTQRELKVIDSALIAQINEEEYDPGNPEQQYQEIEKGSKVYQLGEEVEVDIPVLVEDNPDLQPIPLDDFAIYPTAQVDLQNAILVGHRVRRTANDLRRGVEAGYYDKDSVEYLIEESGPQGRSTHGFNRLDEDTREEIGVHPNNALLTRHQTYDIWECIYEFDSNGDGVDEDCLFTFDYDSKILLRAIPLPYWHGKRHFVAYRPFPRSDFFFGDSLCHILRSLQYQENAATNQALDGGAIANSIIATILNTSNLDLNAGRLDLFKAWKVDSHDEIDFPDIPRPGQNSYIDKQAIRSMIEQASGVNDASAGIQPSKSRPLGETTAILEQAGYKFQDIIRRIQSTNGDVFLLSLLLLYQFLDRDVELEITGREESAFDGLTKQQIIRSMVLTPHGNNINTSRELEMASAEKLVLWFSQQPPADQTPTRRWHVSRRFLHAHGIRDYEAFIGTLQAAEEQEAQPPEPPPPFDPSKISPDDVTALAWAVSQRPELAEVIQQILPLAGAMGLIPAQSDPQAEMELKREEAQADIEIARTKAASEIEIAQTKAGLDAEIQLSKAQTDIAAKEAQTSQALAITREAAKTDNEVKKESAEVQNQIAKNKPKNNGR